MTRGHHRRTPLHHAAARNRLAIVQLLLELGADPNGADATGATALTTACRRRRGSGDCVRPAGGRRPARFPDGGQLGRYGEAEAMLRDDPARIGPDGRDTIALHLAVSKRNLTTIRWLIAHGVDVNAKRLMWDCNHTALHMTAESGEIDIARLLLDAGADPNVCDDKVNSTALGWANYFGRAEFAEFIREKGGAK